MKGNVNMIECYMTWRDVALLGKGYLLAKAEYFSEKGL